MITRGSYVHKLMINSFGARPLFGKIFSATLPALWTLSSTAGCWWGLFSFIFWGTSLPWSSLRTYLFPWVQISRCVRGVVLSSPSRREAFAALPLSLVITRTRQVRGGGQFFTLTVCQGFGRRRRSLIISILWIEGSSSSSTEPRISCGGSFASDLFKLHDGGIVHHFSKRHFELVIRPYDNLPSFLLLANEAKSCLIIL